MQAHITTEPRPARSNAFKIKKCGESTNAGILEIIKGAPDLKVLQERITCIRRTKAGELLLEMDKPCFVDTGKQSISKIWTKQQRRKR